MDEKKRAKKEREKIKVPTVEAKVLKEEEDDSSIF